MDPAATTPSAPAVAAAAPASAPASVPTRRLRRLRRTPALRRLVAEVRLGVDDLIAPLFVREGIHEPLPIASMPGQSQHTIESLVIEAKRLVGLGIPSTSFYRNVTEFRGIGKVLWKGVRWLDIHYPELSAYLGNYVMFSLVKAQTEDQVSAAGERFRRDACK